MQWPKSWEVCEEARIEFEILLLLCNDQGWGPYNAPLYPLVGGRGLCTHYCLALIVVSPSTHRLCYLNDFIIWAIAM